MRVMMTFTHAAAPTGIHYITIANVGEETYTVEAGGDEEAVLALVEEALDRADSDGEKVMFDVLEDVSVCGVATSSYSACGLPVGHIGACRPRKLCDKDLGPGYQCQYEPWHGGNCLAEYREPK